MPRLVVGIMLSLACAGAPLPALAQSASPEASPLAVTCRAPALPPGTPTAMDGMAPAGTPQGDMAGAAMGTPAVAEQATPEMAAMPAGEPADEATTEQGIAAARNVIACLASGDSLGFAALLTPNYLMTSFGTDNPYDIPLFMEGFPPIEERALGDVQTHPDGRISVDVSTIVGGTQVDRFRAFFIPEGDFLLLDEEVSLPIEDADVTVEATMIDFAFELSQSSVPAGALVAFTLPNEGQYPHEFAVVRLPEGVTVEQVLADPAMEEQIEFFGGAYAEPGETGYIAFQDLEPGTYTAVCFVDIPDGIPHVMRGMVAEFTVEDE